MDTTPTPDQQAANRLFLAFNDMREAMRYLDAYAELAEMQRERGDSFFFDHCEAILSAAIVAYCRPFKKSRSQGQAAPKLTTESLDAIREHQELHALLETKRDTFIAHADWGARSTTFIRIDGNAVLRQSPMPSVHKGLNIEDFRELVKAVGYECRRKAFELDFAHGASRADAG